jgi:hypothetical protein
VKKFLEKNEIKRHDKKSDDQLHTSQPTLTYNHVKVLNKSPYRPYSLKNDEATRDTTRARKIMRLFVDSSSNK